MRRGIPMISKIVRGAAMSLVVSAAMSLGGCATDDAASLQSAPSQQSTQWVGKDTAALVAEWGEPTDKKTQSDGSEVWVYRKAKQATVGDQQPVTTTRKERTETYMQNGQLVSRQVAYEETNYDPSKLVDKVCEYSFTIKDGVVKSVAAKGSGCS